MDVTYIALKPVRVGGKNRPPGSLVPEAANWPRRNAYLSRGKIAPVPIESLGDDDRALYDEWAESPAGDKSVLEDLNADDFKIMVEDGEVSVEEAYEYERTHKQRKGVIDWLQSRLEADHGDEGETEDS